MASYVGIPNGNPTKYLGPNVAIVSVVTRNRSPTGADVRQGTTGQYYPISSFWIVSKDPTTGAEGDLWWLSKIVANVAYWIQIASSSGGGPIWNQVTGTSQGLLTGNAYVPLSASLTTFTLPATANFGDFFIICGFGTGGWTLAQNSGQSVAVGTLTTTPGITGSVSSTNERDTIQLVCVVANTTFKALDFDGNLTVI